MIARIVVVGNPARLSCRLQQLVVDPDDGESATVPLEDLGILILDHPRLTTTQAMWSACAEHNVAVVICDAQHLPTATLTPLSGHTLHSRTLAMQVATKAPARKRLWQAIIRAKIREQGKVLESVMASDSGLKHLITRVRSGDPDNIEAQAARIYWAKLFGPEFRRRSGSGGRNGALNYGYAILRAAVARAVVGAGLHPAVGIHHHNQYDALCLADDLMEPLRPLVDLEVFLMWRGGDGDGLDAAHKQRLLAVLGKSCTYRGRQLPVMVALHEYVASIKQAMAGGEYPVEIPAL